MRNVIEIWPSLAEFFVYDETIYRLLAGDVARNDAYRRACQKVLRGKTVVEIGPGAELVLSQLCLEAGATKIYAIEILEETYRRAAERVEELGLGDRIVLIHGDATRVELPEKVDYCVSEIVGPIGGVEGSAAIINSCRRFLHHPANMLPARTLTKIAAVHVPEQVVQAGFSAIGMHYVEKTFQQVGRPFDIRVCLKNVTAEDLLSTAAPFEDLDYTRPITLDERHDIRLDFTRDGMFTGFLVWLELFLDADVVLDVLQHQASWLPVYFPLSRGGLAVGPGDRFEGVVTRTLSANGINPDYFIEGTLYRADGRATPLAYAAPHFEQRFKANGFYHDLFARYRTPLAIAGPPRPHNEVTCEWPDTLIPRLFDEQVAKTPERVALVHGCADGPRAHWTYRAIYEKSNRLAHLLQAAGVGPEVPVAVLVERSPETVMALLAILKAGGAYVPLDPAYPQEHLRFVLADTRAPVVLTEHRLAAALPDTGLTVICVDGDSVRHAPGSARAPVSHAGLDHLALILYTSGSTGQPKGVAMSQRHLLNRFHWLWQSYPFLEGERVGERTPATFIPSLWGMLGGLLKGTPTVILPSSVVKDPHALVEVLAAERVTRVAMVPVLLKLLLDAEPNLAARLPHLKLWFTAGEVLTPELYERFLKACPHAVLSNDYGSTEVSGVLAFDSRWSDERFERVPVGRPIANCRAYVLDDQLNPVVPGGVGELFIGGTPVSRGYVNHPDWTAEKFIPDPFGGVPASRLYGMGDLASWRSDGMIELRGRRDHQVKIRGIRVELGGIESVLAQHQAVRENAVTVYRNAKGEQELAAVVALRVPGSLSPEAVRDYIRTKLPPAMVPAQVRLVEALPRTPNGKIDRRRLSVADATAPGPAPTPAVAVTPGTRLATAVQASGVRQQLRDIVARVLECGPLTEADDDQSFPRLGLHSVAMVELANQLTAWLKRDIGVTELFDHFSIAKLAAHLADHYGPALVEEPANGAVIATDARDVAIVGYSGRFPQAPDCDTFWDNLSRGVDAVREVPPGRWDTARVYATDASAPNRSVGKWGGFLDDIDQFDALFFNCSPREARWMDPQQRIFIEEAWKAFEHAGYSDRAVANRSVGVFVGVRPSDYLSPWHDLQAATDALTLLGNDSAILASRVSHFLNLKGPNLAVDTSCSSSLTAIHLACRSLQDGECEMALAGGVSVLTAPEFFVQASKAGMLSPTGRCRTFDRDADGFAPGEGAGVVVLKTLAAAYRDGDQVYGIIKASAINQDGHTGGLTVPNTLSQTELEASVYRRAGINPETIAYVEAHGTGTPLGDPIEVNALTRAFAQFTERKNFCRIGSVKDSIGHLAAAAGVAGLIKLLLAFAHKTIPPNAQLQHPNPHIDFANSPFVLNGQAADWPTENGVPRRAALSSFGFSGTNAHLLLEEAPAGIVAPPAGKAAYLFTLSAKSATALERKRQQLAEWLTARGRTARIEDVSYTLNAGRSHFAHRLWWVASSLDDLRLQLTHPAPASGPLAETGRRYAAGEDIDWDALHAGESKRILPLPGYPFERKRYWHKDKERPEGERPARADVVVAPPPIFQPRWVAVSGRGVAYDAAAHSAFIVGGEGTALRAALAAGHAMAPSLETADAVYFIDASPAALLHLFDLVKRLGHRRSVALTVVVSGMFDNTNPDADSLAGFCRSLAHERPDWQVRCVDSDDAEQIRGIATGVVAVRAGVVYTCRLAPATLPSATTSVFREGGVYLIVGGAGGIGFALARYLADRYHARSVLVGRRALSADRLEAIAGIGARYLRADVSDADAIETAVHDVLRGSGALHGVVHAAVELNDAPLAETDKDRFVAGLDAKITGTLALHRAVKGIPLDFFLCFSSVQSFLGNAGQANYAAGCAFQDAWARQTNRDHTYPVQTINWGFWGDVGAVASARYRKLLTAQGVDSIRVDEGMEAVERILAAGIEQAVVVKGDARFLETIGVGAPATGADWVPLRLQQAFAAAGVFARAGERYTMAGLRQRLAVAPQHVHVFEAMVSMLIEAGILSAAAGDIVVAQDVSPEEHRDTSPRGRLVETCLAAFVQLLRGDVAATDILFPESSTHLVEDLYKGLAETEAIRDEVVGLAARSGSGPIRILEIGAGTGATSAVVLDGLRPFADRVRYVYTDVSRAFTRRGERQFGSTYPFVECRVFDVEKDPASQGFEAHSVDVVIAANVLHATRDVGQALQHVRALLTPGGRLILHEQTTLESFLTVTFGWLDGWWRFKDGPSYEGRVPNGPLFTERGWQSVLAGAGFGHVSVAAVREQPTQHLLVARAAPAGRIRDQVMAALCSVLELETADIELDRPFVEYGVDSILAQALVHTLNRVLACRLKASDVYNYPNLRALSAYLETLAVLAPGVAVREAPPPVTDPQRDVNPRHVAIIGMSGRFPGADDVETFWDNLAAGRSSIEAVPASRWNADAIYDPDYSRPNRTNSKWGGFLADIDCFDPHFFNILPIEAEWMDPQQRLFLQEAWRALEDAGYSDRALHAARCGVFVGCKEGDYSRLFGDAHTSPYHSVGTNSAILAARISYALNLKGPSLAIDTACSSSLVAIHLACERLRQHPDEIAIAGGVAVMCTSHTHLLLGKSGMLSPDGRCKAFARGADGFVPGEAVGAVVLKPLAAALRDNDHIHGVILASDMNQDGRTNGITAPSAPSQASLEREVYAQAGIAPATIGYIETHGTGTRLGDPIEIAALKESFGADGDCALGSVKSNIGHTLAAAGIASVIKVLACLEHRALVPTLYLDRVSDEFDLSGSPFRFTTELTPWHPRDGTPRRAAVSAFGFSGTNVHMVIEESPARASSPRPRPAHLIALSAKTPAALARRVGDLRRWLERNPLPIADVAYTLLRGRSHFAVRAAIVARDSAELVHRLAALAATTSTEGVFPHHGTVRERPALKQWGAQVVDEIANGDVPAEQVYERLLALADLFAEGYDLDWDRLVPPESGRRTPLPTYPFARERYWVPDIHVPAAAAAKVPSDAEHAATRAMTVLTPTWRASAPTPRADRHGTVVVVAGPSTRALAESLFDDRPVVVLSSARALDENRNFDNLAGCIDLTALEPGCDWDEPVIAFLQHQIEAHRRSGLKLLQVCHLLNAYRVDATRLEGARLAGLYRTLGAEYQHVDSRVLDTDITLAQGERLKAQILDEWRSPSPSLGSCCYRSGERFVADFAPVPTPPPPACSYPSDRTLVITGGTRGVGAAMAQYLVARGARKLAILGRTPLSEQKLADIRALEAQGAQVEIYIGSLADRDALVRFRDRIHQTLGPVVGVLHCAGLARTEHPAFIRKPLADIRAVCEPKIAGLRSLDEVFSDHGLEFFVLFSSVAAAWPLLGSGQSDYAMANAYMDWFAEHQFLAGKRYYRSIQWPQWDGVGMGGATSAVYDATGLLAHTLDEGFRMFERALSFDRGAVLLPCVHASPLHWEPAPTSAARAPASVAGAASVTTSANWLGDLFARELKLNGHRLDPHVSFVDHGVDSILSAELVKAIGRALGVTLPPTLLFEHTNLHTLSGYLDRTYPEAARHRGSDATLHVGEGAHPAPADRVRLATRTTDVAVIGVSCRFPEAPDAAAYWDLLVHGRSAITTTPPDRWTAVGPHRFGGFVSGIDEFDARFFQLDARDARVMDPQARLMLEECARALYDAGYDERALDGRTVGVFIGARSRPTPALDDTANPILAVGQNYIAANISRFFNFHGPSLVVDTACSSGLVGAHLAVRAMQSGEIECAVVGAVSLLLDDAAHRLFESRGLLCPDGAFHLFDRRANGVVLGEGAAAVLLKPLDTAIRDGDRVLAVIKGIAVNNNGRTAGPNAPNLQAQKDVVVAALAESGKRPAEIGGVETSGAGSEVSDLLELKALDAVLGGAATETATYLGNAKTNIGHLLTAAGLASFVKAVLSVAHGEHPPCLSGSEPLTHFDFARAGFAFNADRRSWQTSAGPRVACVTSFPDGGTNCCVVVESFTPAGAPGRRPRTGPLFDKQLMNAAEPEPVLSAAAHDDFWGLTD